MRFACFLVVLFALASGSVNGQTVNYVMQTGNFNSQQTNNVNSNYLAGAFNNIGTEIGLYANGSGSGYTGDPGVAIYQIFTDNGNGTSGNARPLTVGDQFQITCYVGNSSSFFDGSNAGITFNENVSFSSFNDLNSNQRARFQINKNGNWFVANPSGAGFATPGQDVTFTLRLTSSNTGILTISSLNGAITYDLDLANSPSSLTPITSFALWNQTSGGFNDMIWKDGSLTNLGVVEFGGSNADKAITGVISDGLVANSTSDVEPINFVKEGSATITLSAANTYSGTTTIESGRLRLGGSERINNLSDIILAGGIFNTGDGVGYNETLGTLQLIENSTIELGTGNHSIHFSSSNALSWTANKILTISGWTGIKGETGTNGKIFLGNDALGLSLSQLSQISFAGFTGGATILPTGEIVPAETILSLFDDFQRLAGNIVGEPSSNPGSDWLEYETQPSGARTDGGGLWLGSNTQGREIISFNMSDFYPASFDASNEEMRWAFNMMSNRPNPSGFNDNNYGSAFILGCNMENFTDPDAYGYAVVMGGVGSPDPLRLVRFEDGFTLNSNLTDIASFPVADDNSFFSINVEYNSCTQSWNLLAREEMSFTNPSIGAFSLLDSGFDNSYTSSDLPFMGVLWNHSADVTEYLRIDNIYTPNVAPASNMEYTWSGGASGSFISPGNWTPSRDCVRSRDRLVFEAGTFEVIDVPDQTIGQIIVRNAAMVTLKDPSLGGTPSTLLLTGGTGLDLNVELGSELNLDVVNTVSGNGIVLDMLANTTGEIAGTLRFANTSTNLGGRPHQLLVTDTDALHITNGGRVEAIYLLLGNNPFGDSRGGNAVVFEMGSTYLHGSGSNPFGDGSPPSKVVFEPGSWYHFTSPNLPSVSGRVFANFRYEAGVMDLAGTNNYFIDTLQVLQGTANFKLNATATIAGDIEVAPGATLNFNPTSGTAQVLIDAPVAQNIYGDGNMTLDNGVTLNLQNQNRINIQKNITITGAGPGKYPLKCCCRF